MTTLTPQTEELIWIKETKKGNRQAFSQIVEKYQMPIYTLCYRKLGDPAEAEDAAQETFIRAYFKLTSYDETRKFSTWLFSIAVNHCIDRLRKRHSQPLTWDDLATHTVDDDRIQPEDSVIIKEQNQTLYQLVESLPEDYQEAVILKYWYTMSYQEIAQLMNTTVSAIKNRLFRARRLMAQGVV